LTARADSRYSARAGANEMLPRLAKFFDGIAIRMMFGSLSTEVTFEYEKMGHPRKEAQELARQEMFASMRVRNLNVDSYSDVRSWKKSYMAERTRARQS
jgi:hypothetical protein